MTFIERWQTLIAGLFGLGGGAIAYFGALRAANRQVAAIESQTEASNKSRTESEQRSRHAMLLAIRTEARRLEVEAAARKAALPSAPQWSNLKKPDAIIPSSALLRGERTEIALLGTEIQDEVAALAAWLDRYNAHAQTRGVSVDGGILADQQLLDLVDELIKYANGIELRF
jgi:hypothetical protein